MTKAKRILKIIFFGLIGVAILWFITKGQDVNRIKSEMLGANLFWIFLSMLAGGISHYIRALRWNLMINSMGYSTKASSTFNALMTGYLANLVVPRLGEVTRCAVLSKKSKIPFNSIAGSVVAERVFDMVCLSLLIFLTIVFQFEFLKDFLNYYIFTPFVDLINSRIWLFAAIIAAGLIFMVLGYLYFKSVDNENIGLPGKIKRQLKGFWNGMLSLAYIEHKPRFVVHTVLIWGLYFMMVYLSFLAIEATATLGLSGALTVLALGSLGIVAPVPGGIGAYHFIVITTLTQLFGVEAESATSYAVLAHASQMVLVLILGGWAWFALSASDKNFKITESANTE